MSSRVGEEWSLGTIWSAVLKGREVAVDGSWIQVWMHVGRRTTVRHSRTLIPMKC